MTKRRRDPLYRHLTIQFEGRPHTITYYVDNGMVNVSCAYGSEWAILYASPAELLARIIGRELLEKGKR